MDSKDLSIKLRSFEAQILFFNGMYKLPIAPYPSLGYLSEHPAQRLRKFKETLQNELNEVDDILRKIGAAADEYSTAKEAERDILTDIADWLGDIQIYCASEMAKFGIPISDTLRIIMMSNFSKLQADGTVKYDENGKVEKGPNYWKPEPLLKKTFESIIQEHTNESSGTM